MAVSAVSSPINPADTLQSPAPVGELPVIAARKTGSGQWHTVKGVVRTAARVGFPAALHSTCQVHHPDGDPRWRSWPATHPNCWDVVELWVEDIRSWS
jgi:hypothetical protein